MACHFLFCLQYFKRLPEGFAMDCEFTFEEGPEQPPTSVMFGNSFLKEKAYSNSQLEVSLHFTSISV